MLRPPPPASTRCPARRRPAPWPPTRRLLRPANRPAARALQALARQDRRGLPLGVRGPWGHRHPRDCPAASRSRRSSPVPMLSMGSLLKQGEQVIRDDPSDDAFRARRSGGTIALMSAFVSSPLDSFPPAGSPIEGKNHGNRV